MFHYTWMLCTFTGIKLLSQIWMNYFPTNDGDGIHGLFCCHPKMLRHHFIWPSWELFGPLTILGPGDKSSHISTICYLRTPPFNTVMLREGLALTSVSHTFSLLAVSNWLPFTWRPSVTSPALPLSFLATKPPSWVCVTLIIIPALSFFSAACVHSSLSATLRLSQQLTFSPFLRPLLCSPLSSCKDNYWYEEGLFVITTVTLKDKEQHREQRKDYTPKSG